VLTVTYRYYRPRYRRRSGAPGLLAGAAVAAVLAAAAASAHGHHGSVPSEDGMAIPASASSAVALGRQMAAADGWKGHQWHCLDWLWTRESGWRMVWNAQGSRAYGIPQALPASKMASAGPDWMTDPATQIRWGIRYIRDTYGTPCNAWAQELRAGWY
jgi:hypothetical protein